MKHPNENELAERVALGFRYGYGLRASYHTSLNSSLEGCEMTQAHYRIQEVTKGEFLLTCTGQLGVGQGGGWGIGPPVSCRLSPEGSSSG